MDFNSDQFDRQPGPGQLTPRGFGDQAMRRYRVTPPAPQPDAGPQPAASTGHQYSLFQASELAGAAPEPTFSSGDYRRSQYALDGMSNAAMAAQRVKPPQRTPEPPATPSTASGSGWHQDPITYMGPTQTSMHAPGAAGPTPTHWPTPEPAVSDAPRPAGVRKVNLGQVRNAGPSRISPAQSPVQDTPDPAAPALPARPTNPPSPITPSRPSPITPTMARAGRIAGVGAFVAAKALQSLSKPATDPKRSGKPLYKSSTGWLH